MLFRSCLEYDLSVATEFRDGNVNPGYGQHKDVDWMRQNAEGYDVAIDHCSDYYAQLAVQGPEAEQVMEEVLGLPCKELEFYTAKTIANNGANIVVSRTGYTGEDGFEIYGPHEFIVE